MTKLTTILGYLGLTPFLLPLAVMVNGFEFGNGLQGVSVFGFYGPYVFISYSAVILSFLTGTLWARARLGDDNTLARAGVIVSNLLALTAWASLLLIYVAPLLTVFAVCLLLAGYLALLYLERFLQAQADKNYWKMRLQLTAIVCAAHLILLAMMVMEL